MKSEQVALEVFARVGELVALPNEEENEHPADSAFAAYLWLFSASEGDCSARAMEIVLECKQCWWARKMAEYLGSERKSEKKETLQIHKGS